ncbi:MAG: hypothetical protein H6Q23_425, partial [Bacteroidetes bacterium]|nr:hypothetical protein [Bacteroidota bacterium]
MIRPPQIVVIILVLSSLSRLVSGKTTEYSKSSVLASGRWFKIAVTEDGVYRIEFARLKQLGLENPSNPRIFGNNCGQLSYYNDGSEPDDLKEIAVFTHTGSDGIFNEGDYLLFYGKATNRWIYDYSARDFTFLRHNYSDTAFYFITSGAIQGKRITFASLPLAEPDFNSSVSDALYIHETESENLIHSGREWYQPVNYLKDTEIDPGFKDIVTSEKVKYAIRVLARASVTTHFRLEENGSSLGTLMVAGINLTSTTGTYAQATLAEGEALPLSSAPVYKVSFSNNGEISAKGWIDYVKIHARRLNRFEGQTMHYTDSKSVGTGSVTEFTIKSSSDGVVIWDVSDPLSARIIQYSRTGDNI